MTTATMPAAAIAAPFKQDATVIGLIGLTAIYETFMGRFFAAETLKNSKRTAFPR